MNEATHVVFHRNVFENGDVMFLSYLPALIESNIEL